MKRNARQTVLMLCVGLFFPLSLYAHHALEYLEVESFESAKKREGLFYTRFDYFVDDSEDLSQNHWEITPGISYGVWERITLDIHIHFSKFESGHFEDGSTNPPFFEAVAPNLLFQITPSDKYFVNIGVALTYEIPLPRARELLGSRQGVEGTLIIGKNFWRHSNVTLNIVGGIEEGGERYSEWRLGTKHPLTSVTHGISAGVEVTGDFKGEEVRVLPGFYVPILPNLRLKLGFGFGFFNENGSWKNSSHFASQFLYSF